MCNLADDMVRHAHGFDACARMCESESIELPAPLENRFVAGLVNSAFACELYLKALLVSLGVGLEEIKRKGKHSLKGLFVMLQEADNELARKIEIEVDGRIVSGGHSFSQMIDSSEDAFEILRYCYEPNNKKSIVGVSPQFLRVLRKTLNMTCNDWIVNKRQ